MAGWTQTFLNLPCSALPVPLLPNSQQPYKALHCTALTPVARPGVTQPYLALHCPTLPCPSWPCPALSCPFALPNSCLSSAGHALFCTPLSYLFSPCTTLPSACLTCAALPCHSSPCLALHYLPWFALHHHFFPSGLAFPYPALYLIAMSSRIWMHDFQLMRVLLQYPTTALGNSIFEKLQP